ncbi:transposase [Chloroflexota bacterium]
MKGVPQGRYTKEFREEAVKMVTEESISLPESARRLSLPPSTLATWVKTHHKEGRLRELPSVIFSPHISGNMGDNDVRATEVFLDNLRRYLNRGEIAQRSRQDKGILRIQIDSLLRRTISDKYQAH